MRKNRWRGRLIVVEGLDGAGKTTALKKILGQMAKDHVYIKGVGKDNLWGSLARRFAKTVLFLLELLFTVYLSVRPALRNGAIVLVDKYFYMVASHVPDVNTVLNKFFLKVFGALMIQPDFIIYFQVSLEERLNRLRCGPYNRFHQMLIKNPGWTNERERVYVEMVKQSGSPVYFLDTTGRTPEEVATALGEMIEKFIKEDGYGKR